MSPDSTPDKTAELREMSLLGHIDELRTRLIISLATLVISVIVCFFFADQTLEILIRPAQLTLDFSAEPDPDQRIDALNLAVARDGQARVIDAEKLFAATEFELNQLNLVLVDQDGDTSGTLINIPFGDGKSTKSNIVYDSPIDPLMVQFKVALIMGILISLIVWVWQIWLFIEPGLTDKEKRVVGPMLVWAIFLFPLGALFAYGMVFLIVPMMNTYVVPGIDPLYNIGKYLKLLTTMMIVFGFIFELPVVLGLLARIGVVTPAFLTHYRRHIWVGLAVVAMLVTPADPVSMMVALVPLIALFELSVVISRPMALLRQRDEEADY